MAYFRVVTNGVDTPCQHSDDLEELMHTDVQLMRLRQPLASVHQIRVRDGRNANTIRQDFGKRGLDYRRDAAFTRRAYL